MVESLLVATRAALSEAWDRTFSATHQDAADGDPDKAEVHARRKHLGEVAKHLVLLGGAPTDDEVATDLPARDREMRASGADLTGTTRDRFLERVERLEALHAAWLVDLDGTPRDAHSGPPAAAVGAHRLVTEPELGEMPVGLPEARARAWLAADPEERLRAAAVAQYPHSAFSETGWRMQEAQQGIRRAVVTELLKFAYANPDSSPEARALVELWERQDLRGFIREFFTARARSDGRTQLGSLALKTARITRWSANDGHESAR